MNEATQEDRLQHSTQSPEKLAAHQLEQLNCMLREILPHNKFYFDKFNECRVPLSNLDDLACFPYTFKDELIGSHDKGDLAKNLTYSIDQYVRFHRTSGTRGRPMVVMDTEPDWKWWIDAWQYVLDAAELTSQDRCFFAFSFGPFIGFWSAFDAVAHRGCLAVPSGGLSTLNRLELILQIRPTTIFCTPTYALHMAEVAHANRMPVDQWGVNCLVLAGEPGGSIPSIRERIESAWNAKVIDHSGATEVGPWGYSNSEQTGIFVNEAYFIPEFISLDTGTSASEGELSELVLTSLGRNGAPLIRYRTGDLVRPSWNYPSPCNFVLLEGGVLGRADDMLIIRGVNVFPTSIEQILRGFPEVVEYRLTAHKRGEMDGLRIEVEDRKSDPERIAQELQLRLGLKVDVEVVEIGSLPRFEGKGRRFVDQRSESQE